MQAWTPGRPKSMLSRVELTVQPTTIRGSTVTPTLATLLRSILRPREAKTLVPLVSVGSRSP